MQFTLNTRFNSRRAQLLVAMPLVLALLVGCSDGTTVDNDDSEALAPDAPDLPVVDDAPTVVDETPEPVEQPPIEEPPVEEPTVEEPPVVDTGTPQTPADVFQRDGYGTVDVVRLDVRTVTIPGLCTEDDLSGCTLADVNNDIDTSDNLTPEIEVKFQAVDYADDGSTSNAELRQRGATSRQFPQKSYRIKIDKGVTKWRNERRLQLNKHPTDVSRMRNKLSFDLMIDVPNLPSLRTQFVNLWVDDGQGPVDFGLFTHIEAVHPEFLENRGWGEDDNMYKAEQFTFSADDLEKLAIDENGAPLDEDLFEERLEVKTGADDHTQLIAMLTAMNDPAQSFESVLDRYFDRDNVLAWVTVNFLLGQKDITTHNFYLYNPAGSEKFFFLPWDYDAAFFIESELVNSFDNEQLNQRLFYGYARGSNSVFLDRYFRLPGINDTIVSAANTLRQGPLSDARISERAALYSSVIRPFVTRMPDLEFLTTSDNDPVARFDRQATSLPGYVTTNHQVMQEGLAIPMPHTLEETVRSGDQWLFSWTPAHDVLGNSITYDMQISSDVTFPADAIVFDISGIADDPNRVQYSVPIANLPTGQLFYRVVARSSKDPQRFWQVATNVLRIDDTPWYGVGAFE